MPACFLCKVANALLRRSALVITAVAGQPARASTTCGHPELIRGTRDAIRAALGGIGINGARVATPMVSATTGEIARQVGLARVGRRALRKGAGTTARAAGVHVVIRHASAVAVVLAGFTYALARCIRVNASAGAKLLRRRAN